MSSPQDKDRPEAGRDTESGKRGEGANARDAESGGSRTKSGGTYGDWVPDRGQPMENNDRDAGAPPMGDYYTGGGNIDRLAKEPGSAAARNDEASGPKAGDDSSGNKQNDALSDEQGDEERVAEANRNKSFDTTHVHTATTSRKV
jgi:hypothetical protein